MSALMKLAVHKPVKALRLHSLGAVNALTKETKKVEWLHSIVKRSEQEAADRRAFLTCIEGIENALAQVTPVVEKNLQEVSALATELGLAVAREVLGSAIEEGLADPTAAVERCLGQSVEGMDQASLCIRLAPEDLSLVLSKLEAHPELKARVSRAEFVPDPGLDRGVAQVDSGSGRLVYDPKEVLERIADEIRKGEAS